MSKKETAKRYILFIVSLFFSALGVAFTKRGELGVSPISSVANVLSCKFDALSLGTWLIIWNCVLIAGQIVILRRKFQLIQLLQVPLSFLFGWFTDLGMMIVSHIPAEVYAVRLAMVIIGIVILAFGIALSVIANVIMNSGEAFVKAISDTIHKEFGNVKIVFDISCVAAALILSLIFFNFTIVGTREGTVISAFLTGVVVKFFCKRLSSPVNAALSDKG
ncbi:MAG: YitT family protein [Oscillospiraceae bacterium]|nr:YitT family protein [Oscillospiraceae bacterium]